MCKVPTTLVVTGRFHDTYNVQIEQALKENRLLILVLQREEKDKGYTARLRNQYIISQVQHIACGYINPNGSIYGLLAGLNNVTHLLDKEDIRMAAKQEAKPYRWTVAEDKRLLRMFYEDMGIHAIHKAINRPYSTIYKRIKALTMNDEVRVSFFGPFYSDYRVMLLDADYQWELIGSGSAKYLWILSRTPELSQETLNTILAEAQRRGYDTSKLIWVNHK